MDDAVDSELTRDDLIHDLKNVFETITDAAELLATDPALEIAGRYPDPQRHARAASDGRHPGQHAQPQRHHRRCRAIRHRLLHRRPQAAPPLCARNPARFSPSRFG